MSGEEFTRTAHFITTFLKVTQPNAKSALSPTTHDQQSFYTVMSVYPRIQALDSPTL